ncbi:MAG: hypothetical protein KY455_09435 [Euryarchaeota archaeon]|nr:hypothetical protein [Euryarchaeota archaeon]
MALSRPPVRLTVLIGVAPLLLLLAAPAMADHDWGHRYMVVGRVVDNEGGPVAGMPVRVVYGTERPDDPYITVTTSCHGLFYTQKIALDIDRSAGWWRSTDWGDGTGRIHLHTSEVRADDQIMILVDPERERARLDIPYDHGTQRSDVLIWLDQDPVLDQECVEAPDPKGTYLVGGRVQRLVDGGREDLHARDGLEVVVTLDTKDGALEETVPVNALGDYFAFFHGVTVSDGALVRSEVEGAVAAGPADLDARMTPLHVLLDATDAESGPGTLHQNERPAPAGDRDWAGRSIPAGGQVLTLLALVLGIVLHRRRSR